MNELQFLIVDETGQVYEALCSYYALNRTFIYYRVDGIKPLGLTENGFETGAYVDPFVWPEPYSRADKLLSYQLSVLFPRALLKPMPDKTLPNLGG